MANSQQAEVSKAPRRSERVAVSAEVRQKMVADAAYYIAQRRGFAAGDPQADWAAAEAEIDLLLTDTVVDPLR
jgi:hypothetical protein